LSALHENFLALRLHAGQREELVLEDLARRAWIELNIVTFALVFDDDWST
jgi:hypothetical protein